MQLHRSILLAAVLLLPAQAAIAQTASPSIVAGLKDGPGVLARLIAEALSANPEIQAARSELEAARHRVGPAGALEDPMLEVGLLNVPTESWRLNREDMTMKMLGLAQKLPYPGKRALRQGVAQKDALSVEHGLRETTNRVVRELKVAFLDLGLAIESARQLKDTTHVLEQFRRIAESRYAVGQGTQADALKAQTQLAKMSEELLRMEREIPAMEAELARLLGRNGASTPIPAPLPEMISTSLDLSELRKVASAQRPQLLALRELADKADLSIDLARTEYQPDFDLRFAYGQRENMLDGTRRPDMFSITVAINLPIWGREKIEPRVAEARAMRDQARSMYLAQQNETFARLRQQVAIAEQNRQSVRLYDTAILPQATLAVESALASYRVNRADLLMLFDSQMSLFSYRIGRAAAVVAYNKALAEVAHLIGAPQN
jgi:outer membrane protein TolC